MLQNLGLAHDGAGNPERAIALLEESLAIARARRATRRTGQLDPARLARVLLDERPRPRARALLRETPRRLARARPTPTRSSTASRPPPALAADPRTGARLWGAAGALRAAAGATRQPDEAAFAERVEATLRDAVGPAASPSAVAEGAALLTGRRRRAGDWNLRV